MTFATEFPHDTNGAHVSMVEGPIHRVLYLTSLESDIFHTVHTSCPSLATQEGAVAIGVAPYLSNHVDTRR